MFARHGSSVLPSFPIRLVGIPLGLEAHPPSVALSGTVSTAESVQRGSLRQLTPSSRPAHCTCCHTGYLSSAQKRGVPQPSFGLPKSVCCKLRLWPYQAYHEVLEIVLVTSPKESRRTWLGDSGLGTSQSHLHGTQVWKCHM